MEEEVARKGKIFSGIFWKFSERISAQLVTFVVSIVLARLLDPSDYGMIALIMVFISIADVFVSSGFGSALIQKKDADNVDFSSVFYFNIVFSMSIYLLLYLIAPYIAKFYSMPMLCPTLRILGIRIIIAAINSVQQAYVSRNMLFKRFFWSTLFATLLSGVVGIILAFLGFGIWALVAQYLTNTVVATIILWFTVRWRPQKAFSIDRMKVMFSYGWKLLCAGLMDTGYNQIRNLVIGKLYSSKDLAYYNYGQQYPNLIVTNVNTSISSVIFPAMAQEQDDKVRVKSMTRRAIKISSYIMWPMMAGLCVVAKPLISLMLTDKWLPCVPYLQIACFTYGFWPIHTANLEAIKAMGRSDLFLKLEIIKKIMGVSILIIVMKHGVMAIALSLILTTVLSSVINALPNQSLLNYRYTEQLKDMLPSMMLALVMGVIIYPIAIIGLGNVVTISLQILAGIVVYVVGSKIFHFESFDYIRLIIKRLHKN